MITFSGESDSSVIPYFDINNTCPFWQRNFQICKLNETFKEFFAEKFSK